MLAVSTKFLAEIDLTDKEREICITMCQEFHISTQNLSKEFFIRLARHNYVTPTSYLELINSFKNLLQRKRENILKVIIYKIINLENMIYFQTEIKWNLFLG